MARTKDQSFVNRYLNQYQQNQKSAVSAGQQAASNAASSGVQQMNATGNIELPSLYDPTEDLYGLVLEQQKAQIKAQQAAAKAAQKAQEKARKEAQKAKKQAAEDAAQEMRDKAKMYRDKRNAVSKAVENMPSSTVPALSSTSKKTSSPQSVLSELTGTERYIPVYDNTGRPNLIPEKSFVPVLQRSEDRTMDYTGVPARSLSKTAAVERPASAYDAMTVTEKLTAAQQLSEQVQALQSQIDALERQKVEPKTGAGAYDEEAYSIIQENRQIVEQQDALKAQQKQLNDQLSDVDDALWADPEYINAMQAEITSKSENERIAQYLDPSYKLNKLEEEDAKEIASALVDRSNSIGRKNADMDARQEAQDLFDTAQRLYSKTSNASAVAAGFLDAIPFFREATDALSSKITEQLYPGEERPSVGDSFQNLQTQSPVAYAGGNIGGNLALYAAGSAAARSIPALQRVGEAAAATPAAQAIQKIPVLGRLGTADAITGIVGDTAVDLTLDTAPRLFGDVYQYAQQQELVNQGLAEGKTMEEMVPALEKYYGEYLTPGSIAGDIAKNVGTNLAFNLGGELVPELLKAGGRNLQQALVPSLDAGADAARIAQGSVDEAAQAAYNEVTNGGVYNGSQAVDDARRAVAGNPANGAGSGGNGWQSQFGTADGAGLDLRSGETGPFAAGYDIPPERVSNPDKEPGSAIDAQTQYVPDESIPSLYQPYGANADLSINDLPESMLNDTLPSLYNVRGYGQDSVAAGVDGGYSVSAPVSSYAQPANSKTAASTLGEPEIPEGYKERGFAESIRNKTDLPDEVKQEFVDDPELYRAISNSETSARADAIYSQGLDRSMVEYNRMLSEKDPAAVPLGKKIADDLISQGRRDEAVEVLRQMSQNLTQSGQFSQAAAIALLKNDPMTALQYIQKNIDRMNQEGLQKFGAKKWKNFSLTPEEIDGFSKIEYGDEEALKSAFEQIGKRIQRDYPVTTMQKLVEASHIAMLLNPRTQVRNTGANAAFTPLNILSRKVSAVGQNIYKQFDQTYQPNQSFSISKKSKDLASEAYNMVKDSLSGSTAGKWENTLMDSARNADVFKLRGDTNFVSRLPVLGNAFGALNESLGNFSRKVTGGQNVFENLSSAKSVAENIRQFTYGLLELGDQPFVRREFIDRMGSYIEARGYKSLDEIPNEAFDAATQSALKATFKDDNKLTRLVSRVKRESGLVGEVVLPFTKTPANIAVRAYDYSPAGLAAGIAKWVKNGGDPSAYIDDISKGLTGTAAIALGALLYKAGVITGPASENADQAQYDKMQGKLPFAINVGGNYYTFDWMQPASSALVLGSTLASQVEKDGSLDAESVAEAIRTSLVSMGDTLLDMSPLQSVADIFGGYGTPTENVLSEFAEVPQRLIPSLTGAITRVVDPVQRQTFSNGDPVGTQIASAQSKIPGLSQSLPAAYDTWGREITRADSIGEGIFNQFVNPGEFGNANPTPMDDEISRLFEATGQTSVFPQKANWTETFGGESHKLTNEEYSDYQRTMGQISYHGAFSLMDSQLYNALDDQQKASALESVYSVGRYKALQEIFPDYQVPASAQKSVDVYDAMGADGLASWLEYKAVADADGSGSISQEEAQAALNAIPGLTGDEMAYFYYLTNKNWKNNPYM